MRSILLAASGSTWLRLRATRTRFVRRAVSRFMPGETLEDALRAGRELHRDGLAVTFTRLGENVHEPGETEEVVRHYLDAAGRIREAGLDGELSVKLTQLGLDMSAELAAANLARIAERSHQAGQRLWVDMESSPYVDRTLRVFRESRATHPNLGLCLQAYLRRTRADLESLLPLGPAIRVVKGAYAEPHSVALAGKAEVDENFHRLSARMLSKEAREAGAWLTVGTHDTALLARIRALASAEGVAPWEFEFAMLYGIQRGEQLRLAREGYRTRVLVSYGEYWFPWYMRRLAERPANLGFLLRNLLAH